MLEIEGKLNAWLFCHLARAGLKNGWLMGFVAVCIVADPATFWWRVPLLYLLFTFVATVVVRIAPEAATEGDKDWREVVENKRKQIELCSSVALAAKVLDDLDENEPGASR